MQLHCLSIPLTVHLSAHVPDYHPRITEMFQLEKISKFIQVQPLPNYTKGIFLVCNLCLVIQIIESFWLEDQ